MARDKPAAGEDPQVRKAIDLLRGIANAVEGEARSNPSFARQIAELLSSSSAPAAAPAPPPRNPPAIDPFQLYNQGWEAMLRSSLNRLNAEQLADVIHAYELDPKGRTRRKKAQQLRDWIVDAVESKSS